MTVPTPKHPATRTIQLIVPVYNEGENALRLYERLIAAEAEFHELKFIYDSDDDTTLPFIAQLNARDKRVLGEKNGFGPGVANALKWAFARAVAGPVIVVMGDCSDKLELISDMVGAWERGATIVAPSRYMKGGKQIGGGLIKTTLSRTAGVSLRLLGFPTADATNNFKLYDGKWLSQQQVESRGGFEVALELSYKAFAADRTIVELPTVWTDRTMGESNFKLVKWLPHYLKWYLYAICAIISRKVQRPVHGPDQ